MIPESAEPRSEALIKSLDASVDAAEWGRIRGPGAHRPRVLGPHHTSSPFHHRGLMAGCHISRSGGRPLACVLETLDLAGNTWSPQDSRPSFKPAPSCIPACCFSQQGAEGWLTFRDVKGGVRRRLHRGRQSGRQSKRVPCFQPIGSRDEWLEGTIYSGRVRSPRGR